MEQKLDIKLKKISLSKKIEKTSATNIRKNIFNESKN